MRYTTFFVVLALSLMRMGGGSIAFSQPAEAVNAEYEATIAAALREFDARRYPEAHALFDRAFRLYPNARALRGLGVAAFEMRDYPRAWLSLHAALSHGARPLSPEQRSDVEALLARTELFLARLELIGVPSGATVLVDGRAPVMDGGAMVTGPGRHAVSIEAQGMRLRTYEIEAESGARQRILVELTPLATQPAPTPAPPIVVQTIAPPPEPVERGFSLSWPRRAPRPPPETTRAGIGVLAFAITADAPGYSLSVQSSARGITRLCTLPCELHIDPGTYTFVIERRRRDPLVASPLSLHSNGRLELAVTSRRRARGRRLAFGIVLNALGLISTVASVRPMCRLIDPEAECEIVKPALGGGVAAIILGFGLDIAAASTSDEGRVTYRPR